MRWPTDGRHRGKEEEMIRDQQRFRGWETASSVGVQKHSFEKKIQDMYDKANHDLEVLLKDKEKSLMTL